MILRRFASLFIVFSFLFSVTNHPGKIIAKSSTTSLASAQETFSSSGFFTENKGQ
jgi:hypothetical protein